MHGDDGHVCVMTKVLVIDDEAPIRLLCRVNLEAEKMTVVEAPDGPSGLDKARTEAPDVIVFLTARAEFRDRAKGLNLGGIDYVTKPFNPLELAPLVRKLLERIERGERDELRAEKLSELRTLMESE